MRDNKFSSITVALSHRLIVASYSLELIFVSARTNKRQQLTGAPAVLAGAPLAAQLCSQMLVPPQSLQSLLRRLCWQMLAPSQSLQVLLRRLCSLADASAPAVLAPAPATVMLTDAGARAVLAPLLSRSCSHFLRPICGALSRCLCLPCLPPPPAPPHRRPAAPPCCRQPAPRGTRGTCPAASSARPSPPRLRHWSRASGLGPFDTRNVSAHDRLGPRSPPAPPPRRRGVTSPVKRTAAAHIAGN